MKKNNSIFCFGEILLRMSPDENGNWLAENNMPIYIGGAELNVAHALALWKQPVAYCSALPNNAMSASISKTLQSKNIDTSPIVYSGSRIGIYYLTQGADLKHAGVVYDRAHSAFSELQPGIINWKELLSTYSWFHFSAISPALNEQARLVCLEALKAANDLKMKISIDLNYRSKLWKYGKSPHEVMPELAAFCDVIMGNIWSANTLLNIPVNENKLLNNHQAEYIQHAAETANMLKKEFPKCTMVANTFRFDNNAGIDYYATLHTQAGNFVSARHTTEKITDKVGSGDCFMAGLIYGQNLRMSDQQIIDFAAAAAVGKMMEKGDATQQSVESIKNRMPV